MSTSAISKNLTDVLMFFKERTKKVKLSKFTTDTMVPTKDGRFYMLTKEQRMQQRD
jgi:hypothetical protein